MERLGVITGLVQEADCLKVFPAIDRPLIATVGANGVRAREGALALIDQGCGALISFGTAGGLEPALTAGALVIADAVITPDGERLETDRRWRETLHRKVAGEMSAIMAPLAGVLGTITTAEAKRDLFAATAAAAVDMESHAVARVAAKAGIPFLVLRAIADPASRAIPNAALRGVDANGNFRACRVLAAILAKPWEIPALIWLARDGAQALAALRRVALIGGPRLGLG